MSSIMSAEVLSNAVLEREQLPDGTAVWVAKDLSWDGCIAQAPSREEVLVALDEARRQYAAVMQELKQKVTAPKSPTLPSGWSNGRLGQSVTLAM